MANASAGMFNRGRRGRHDPMPLFVHRHRKSHLARSGAFQRYERGRTLNPKHPTRVG
jgi:hypothetical protein